MIASSLLLNLVATSTPPTVNVPLTVKLFAMPVPVNVGLTLLLLASSSDCKLELPSLIEGAVKIPVVTKSPFPLSVAMFVEFAYHLKLFELLGTDNHKAEVSSPMAKSVWIPAKCMGFNTIFVPTDLITFEGGSAPQGPKSILLRVAPLM